MQLNSGKIDSQRLHEDSEIQRLALAMQREDLEIHKLASGDQHIRNRANNQETFAHIDDSKQAPIVPSLKPPKMPSTGFNSQNYIFGNNDSSVLLQN